MKLAADGGGGVGTKLPLSESSSGEVFEKHKVGALSELRDAVSKAFEGGASNDEVIERIATLARERAENTKAHLQELHEGIRNEGEGVRIVLGEDIQEDIKNLDENVQARIREAVAAFEERLSEVVRATALAHGAEVVSETDEEKVRRLESEIAAIERKQQKRGELRQQPGSVGLVRENVALKNLRDELAALRPAIPDTTSGASSEGASAPQLDVESLRREMAEVEAALKKIDEKKAAKKVLSAGEKIQDVVLRKQLKDKQAEVEALTSAPTGAPVPEVVPSAPMPSPAPVESAPSSPSVEEFLASDERAAAEARLAQSKQYLGQIPSLFDQLDKQAFDQRDADFNLRLGALAEGVFNLHNEQDAVVSASTKVEYEAAEATFTKHRDQLKAVLSEIATLKKDLESKIVAFDGLVEDLSRKIARMKRREPRKAASLEEERKVYRDQVKAYGLRLQTLALITSAAGVYAGLPEELVLVSPTAFAPPTPEEASAPAPASEVTSASAPTPPETASPPPSTPDALPVIPSLPEVTPSPVTPSPASPDATPPVTPDTAPPSPEPVNISAFEQRVLDDEARLVKMQALMDAWVHPTNEPPMMKDGAIKELVTWYRSLVAAERALIEAPTQQARTEKEAEIRKSQAGEPRGENSFQALREAFQRFLLPENQTKYSADWKKVLESRRAVLEVLAESLQARRPPETAKVKTPTAPVAPPEAKPPESTPAPEVPPPSPPLPEGSGPLHGPKTLEEAFEAEDTAFRRLSELVGKFETLPGLDDAPLQELIARFGESLQVFEQRMKETDPARQAELDRERADILGGDETKKHIEAAFTSLYAALGSLTPVEVKHGKDLPMRVEALESLAEVFPALGSQLAPFKQAMQETAALAPKDSKPERSPEELLERDRALIKRLEGLALGALKAEPIVGLDEPGPGEEHGNLDLILLRVHEAFELLEEAVHEPDPGVRKRLLDEREAFLEDPALQKMIELYLSELTQFLQDIYSEQVQEETQFDNRIETLEVLTELFPAFAKNIPRLKRTKQEAALLSFEEREQWGEWAKEAGERVEGFQKILEAAKDDDWYKRHKASVDGGLAFQQGLVERARAFLTAKTLEERQKADREFVTFRRGSLVVPELLPGESLSGLDTRIKKLKVEMKAIEDTQKDEAKKKVALEEKQKQLDPLERCRSMFDLQHMIKDEAALQSLPSDAELAERQHQAKRANLDKREGEKKAPESIDDIRVGMQQNSEQQFREREKATNAAKETHELFSDALAEYHPHEGTAKTFSPIYERWQEEQAASYELLDAERAYNFLDHVEIGVTQGLRSLDRLGAGSLSPEAVEKMWEGLPLIVRRLLTKGGDSTAFSSLPPEERTVEVMKGWLYEALRKVTQNKIKAGQTMEKALETADRMAGKTKALVAEARQRVEGELAVLAQKQRSLELESQQKQPGGLAHKEVRWSVEGPRLSYELNVLKQNQARLRDQLKDLQDLEAIVGTDATKPGSPEEELALELRRQPTEQIMAIMQRQMERKAALTAQDEGRTAALKANPGIMAKPIITYASGKKSVEAKESGGGGGKAPESTWQAFQNSWAGKLMKPFTDLFSGWFE